MKSDFDEMVTSVQKALPDVRVRIDEPDQRNGHWFVDFDLGGHQVVGEWRPGKGFGVSSSVDNGYGEGPEEVFETATDAANRTVELLRTRSRTRPPDAVLLRQLRTYSKLTQEELSHRLGIAQGAVSRMERRRDMSVSTLRRFVEAMGGQLELTVKFPDRTMHIGQFDIADEPDKVACRHIATSMRASSDSEVNATLGSGDFAESSAHSEVPSNTFATAESTLTEWIRIVGSLIEDDLPLQVELQVQPEADAICHLDGSTILIEAKLANHLSQRLASPLVDVCTRLVTHEVGHYLARAHWPHAGRSQRELNADYFAGWIDSAREECASLGASIFYELGCHHRECSHPAPRARLDAYLRGFQSGATRHVPDSAIHKSLARGCETPPGRWHEMPVSFAEAKDCRPARKSWRTIGLEYVVLRTTDLAGSRRFYATLGLPLVEEKHGQGPLHYAAELGNTVLELYPTRQPVRPTRLGLKVARVAEKIREIKALGLSTTVVRQEGDALVVRDPGGNDIELIESAA